MKRLILLIICLSLAVVPVSAEEDTKYVVLSFDDGPSGRFTQRLLDGLARRQVKANFLLCGYRLENYPELGQRIFHEGHEIGFHGYSHHDMSAMSTSQITKELQMTWQLLPKGCNPVFLRPPGGKTSPAIQKTAKQQNLGILEWSVDPKDWALKDAASVIRRVTEHVQDGDIILLHDMSDSSVDAALAIVDILQARGFTFVTASELFKIREKTVIPGEKYCRIR